MAILSELLADVALSVDDVTLVPGRGILDSRSEAQLRPFIYSAPMDCVTGYRLTEAMVKQNHFAVISRKLPSDEYEATIVDFADSESVFVAVGLCQETVEDVLGLLADNVKVNLALDVAHGDMETAHAFVRKLRANPRIRHIMSGSICTPQAACHAIDAGCTHLRVGVGPGAACTTRLITGIGVPNLTAVHKIHHHLKFKSLNIPCSWERKDIQIIADGGIKYPGQAVKYIAAGADAVMLGSALSKTYESAGWKLEYDHSALKAETVRFPIPEPTRILVKTYRGQASAEFQRDYFGKANRAPEGASSQRFVWDNETTVERVIGFYEGGMASAISYLGITSMEELHKHLIHWERITPAGYIEGTPHGT